ncbi:hypothetical protein ACJ73_05014 [Blastomyces percursus]|uniref:Uncharacterized protein n=1 Tax=Blastomyces percursus TaxID=1658174 RepID=A0A1J9R6M0_9EURO|nr:hypothetical protein ACJ73_05014 [Blastomyces percursus]
MGVVTVLSQFILLGLASAQIIKDPLVNEVRHLDAEIAAALPGPQKYSLEKWPEEDIHRRGMPSDSAWGGSVYEPEPILLWSIYIPSKFLREAS